MVLPRTLGSLGPQGFPEVEAVLPTTLRCYSSLPLLLSQLQWGFPEALYSAILQQTEDKGRRENPSVLHFHEKLKGLRKCKTLLLFLLDYYVRENVLFK